MTRPLTQPDLFLAAITDSPWRDGLDLMSVPVVSLSKSKRVQPIRFSQGGVEVEVSAPAHIGLATVWDLDIVLWAISQMNEVVGRGETPPPTVHAPVYDILKAIRRGTGGDHYDRLKAALDRLVATTIRTNMRTRGGRRWETFHLLEAVAWEQDDAGRSRGVSITLPDWLMRAVMDRRVLALDPRYFEVTSGLGRWLYRVARKQAGDNSAGWRWTVADLHSRSGVTRPLRSFAADLRKLVAANDLPEYALTIYTDATGAEAVQAVRRSKLALDEPGHEPRIRRNRRDPA